MRLRRLPFVFAATALALAFVASCAATTRTKPWVAPGYRKASVKKVLVLGVSGNPLLRRFYEDSFAVELEKLGYQAVSGYLWAPDAKSLDKGAVTARIMEDHVTNVIVTRVISASDVVPYSGPTLAVGAGSAGSGGFGPVYYGSWSTFYATGYAAIEDAAYSAANEVVTLETNFYDVSGVPDALVWSGASATWTDRPRSRTKIGGIIGAIVHRMRASRVL